MESAVFGEISDSEKFTKTPVPISKSPGTSPSIRSMTQTVIVSLVETVTHDITYGCALPKNFKKGIMMFDPKKGMSSDINDFRPISLLNTDYKIVMKLLKERLLRHLGKVVSTEQSCMSESKNIYYSLNKLREVVAMANQTRTNKLLLSIDFDHAFDRVNHKFLWKDLESMKLDEKIVKVLKNLYDDTKSIIQVNRNITREIKIESGVRQGCPMSMVLFVLYIEPSLLKLKERKIDISVYADDLTMVVGKIEKINVIKKLIDDFILDSGAQINKKKCVALELGPVNRISLSTL
ncbi:hypothetical protein JTB14_024448 [Gonioctena quinquepunctata]|nr:hypothetical protein JTB14_024448 [Gonioctena quinquepunctata]